jgi:small-conductance mechanosensitive channel
MNIRHWIAPLVLASLVALLIAGMLWTRPVEQPVGETTAQAGQAPQTGQPGSKNNAPRRKQRVVDMSPLVTARRIAALATTPEEQDFARQAVRLANHSVDLAFTNALLRVTENPPEPTPEILELTAAKQKAAAAVDAGELLIKQLTKRAATASETEQDGLEDQLEVAKAQLELAQDELDEAGSDLERVGGDPQARIRRLKAARDAAEKESTDTTAPAAGAAPFRFPTGSFLQRYRAWSDQRDRMAQLALARQEALDGAQRIDERRAKIAERMKNRAQERQAALDSATGFATDGAAVDGDASSKDKAAAALTSLRLLASDQRLFNDMGRRFQDQQDLAATYEEWGFLVETQARVALHKVIKGLLVIVSTLFAIFMASRLTEFLHFRKEAKGVRVGTLRTVVRLSIQIVGVLVIVFAILGVPSETTTILGLAGAGLTVAMKDFIVSFFGWFVLIGRNGIRVGDWVEIKGVSGEVVDIGLLRTVLMETSSVSDSGHPTGRRVVFANSFAIEGHFFNFSTSGQWMWDELQVLVPPGEDLPPLIDGIRKLVEDKTAANGSLAESEWQNTTTRYRVKTFSTGPGINVVPTVQGVQIHVRYVTRAHESNELRRELNNAVVELLHGRGEPLVPQAGAVGA